MTEVNQIYKCNICGNIVEVNHVGGGELVCCNKPMNLLIENTEDAATEKHVPVITKDDNGVKVVIGEVEHPMQESHYVEWIDLIVDGISYKKFLLPKDKPEVLFEGKFNGKILVREYCNLHGLWKIEVDL